MDKFTTLTGVAAPLPIVNIDTDMIIPKDYLKTIKRTGLGAGLFAEMRFNEDGSENPDFVLNKPAYRKAQILVAGDNFGCGSSREHAPWALLDFGVRCVISTSFADIFYNNCFKNGILPIVVTPEQLALLMDASRAYGEGFTAMMVGRAASQRGYLMPERQYPVRIPPSVPGAAPLEFTLAITRQESSFDPRARSHANARGMMQFVPATGRAVARQLGLPYSDERLYDPDFNMSLGSYHLADLTSDFGGSMLLTTVGYNAGPARPPQWVARCGDPRGGSVDPIDFIECAPFTETRNYMMRVMENMQVYKARLNGGSAPLTLSQDLRRGAPAGPRPYAAYSGEDALRTPEPEPSE